MTPSSQDLAALLVRVEGAEGANLALDCAMFETIGMPDEWFGSKVVSHFSDGVTYGFNTADGFRHLDCLRAPNVTASLDAALALCARVLPGWDWEIHGPREMSAPTDDGRPTVILRERTPALVIGPVSIGTAASPALALLAAMLRALLALAGDTSGGVEKIDNSACADSSDAPAFGAAGDAHNHSGKED